MGRIGMHGQGFCPPDTSQHGAALLAAGLPLGPGHFAFASLSRFSGLAQFVFGRRGGVSGSPYGSLNSSYSVGDLESHVSRNLSLIRSSVGAERIAFMNQVHSNIVHILGGNGKDCSENVPEADAMITDVPRVAIMARLADCQGIVLYDPDRSVVGVVHSGWRGQVVDAAGSAVKRMIEEFGCLPGSIHAAISPSLGPCCAEFVSYQEIFPSYFIRFMVSENHFDLWELSRFQLQQAGVSDCNISVAGLCTRCRTDLFFSYRAEGVTGRFCVVAMLR